MSEKLRDMLRLHLNLKALSNILSTSSSLTFIEYLADSDAPSATSLWKRIVKFDTNPTKKIPVTVPLTDISSWLQETLRELKFSKEIYILISELGNLPWAKVEILEDKWLLELWEQGYHEVTILNNQKSKAVLISEEEYYWEMYILLI